MKPTFLLFHAECVNEEVNAVCHLVFVPVNDGEPGTPIEFFFNPEAPFKFVCSGISKKQVDEFPTFNEKWHEVQKLIESYPYAVCTADGYGARALCGTLHRLKIPFNSFRYCNAKALCRRSLNLFTYNFDYMCDHFLGKYIEPFYPVDVALGWTLIALKALDECTESSIEESLNVMMINPGLIAPKEFVPSRCIKIYSKRKYTKFNPENIEIAEVPDHPLFEMNVVFTGKMDSMSRNEARAAVIRIGGLAPENLTKETDYLVVGKQDLRVVGEKGLSGKMKTAEKYRSQGLPIEVIDETDFLEMLGDANTNSNPLLYPDFQIIRE